MLRALAHNIPVIVPDLGGMTEIVKDGVNGFVFIPGNSDSLLKILIKIGENPALLNEIKSKIQYPPRIEEEAFEYELLYNKLIQRKGS
jgi:glycosyltransferase involved in cell wall biosynthesis